MPATTYISKIMDIDKDMFFPVIESFPWKQVINLLLFPLYTPRGWKWLTAMGEKSRFLFKHVGIIASAWRSHHPR